MRIDTSRFGSLQIDENRLFLFPLGIIGLETLRQWALVPDPHSGAVAWLQSASRGDRAVALISPRAFAPGYRVHVARRDLAPLQLRTGDETYVLTTLAGHVGHLSTNLRAPVIINLQRRIGCQVITGDDQPLRHPLPMPAAARRMAA